jgi:LDH2 family malate/lactate/ureidoglycolate dehydrogenase
MDEGAFETAVVEDCLEVCFNSRFCSLMSMKEKGELVQGMYQRVDHKALTDFVVGVLQKFGVPRDDAVITSQNLVKADLRGIESHGVARLKRYTDGLKNGVVKVHPNIKIVRESPVTALVDGDSGLGQVVSSKAMNLAIEKAEKNSVGLVGVRNSNHFGIAGFYGLMALEHDLIGIVMTNARPLVAPTFSRQKMIGTNPICVAVPTVGKGFVFDMATSVVPSGKLEVAKRLHEKVPLNWGIDPEGNVTVDPDGIFKGALLPLGGLGEVLGGHKGYGLAMVVEILSGILTGAHWGTAVGETEGPGPADVGHFFGAINPEAFMPLSEFKSRMEQLIRSLKSAEKLQGAEQIYIAGDKSVYTEEVRRRIGVAVDHETIKMLKALGTETGVPFPLCK